MATLYVTETGTQVRKAGERLVLVRGQDVVEEIPLVHVDQVVMVGRSVSLTTAAMFALTQKGADIVYLTGAGRFVSRVQGSEHKHGRLRHSQALMVSDERITLPIAGGMVQGKINNQRTLVRRHADKNASQVTDALTGMDAMQKRISQARNLDELRGLEGQAARDYFALLRTILARPRDGASWGFERRVYYPPTDPLNALLSFGYTLLLNDMLAACQLAGLDPYLGCFHAIDYGRPSMALDMIEEFRPIIVDSILLNAVNRGMIALRDFRVGSQKGKHPDDDEAAEEEDTGAVRPVLLTDDARKRFLTWYEERVNEPVQYPPTGERNTYRRIFLLQAQQMARLMLGQAREYTPLLVR
jgi:CRISP-associated protein Cas1